MQQLDSTDATGGVEISSQLSPQFLFSDAIDHLFQTAVLLLGDEQAAALVVEQAVAEAAVDPCDPAVSFDASTTELLDHVVAASMAHMQKDGTALNAPTAAAQAASPGTCIDTDDLSASGINSAQLQQLLDGPGRAKLRYWLEHLPPSLRTVFVLRAILGHGNQKAASILESKATGWTADQVSVSYRQALCSLASSLVNSTTSRAPLVS